MIEGHYFGMHFLWWIIWIVLLLAVFTLPSGAFRSSSIKSNPKDILKLRLAKGEIGEDEYKEKIKILDEKWGA